MQSPILNHRYYANVHILWILGCLTLYLVDLGLGVSDCNINDFEQSKCISGGYCNHSVTEWTTTCECREYGCTVYLADICKTTGREMFDLYLTAGGYGIIRSQKAQFYVHRHAFILYMHAPPGEKITFEFTEMDFGGSDFQCPQGSTWVYDGPSYKKGEYAAQYPQGETGFCSDDLPSISPIQSTGSDLTVVMRVFYGQEDRKGFNATFSVTGPVNGAWGEWTEWSKCVGSCTRGTKERSRTRKCDSPKPRDGGRQCPGQDTDTEECDMKLECVPDVCSKANYLGCAKSAECDVPPKKQPAVLECKCRSSSCKVYLEDACMASPRAKVKVIGSTGYVRSQAFPHYRYNRRCEMTIEAPQGMWIMLKFTEFDMGGGNSCPQGHLVIFDGASSTNYSKRYPKAKGTGFCSTELPPSSEQKYENIVISSGNYLTVFMDTVKKGDEENLGFVAEFSTVPPGYVHSYLSETDIKIIAFTSMGGIFIITVIALSIWCYVRHKRRKKRLRWYYFQYVSCSFATGLVITVMSSKFVFL